MSNPNQACSHFNPTEVRTSGRYVCQACVAMGDTWVHLRVCQTCGGVHCCDSSKNKHATQHFQQTSHPVVVSAEPDEYWAWCYEDEQFMKYRP
ncbi:MAG: UBP-type zinc finger domain-containing protein [Tunicatimonas sp.]